MTIERISGRLSFTCDGPSCHEYLESGTRDFFDALKHIREHGWVARKPKEENVWKHFCPECRGKKT